jgi:HEAT repeat protein
MQTNARILLLALAAFVIAGCGHRTSGLLADLSSPNAKTRREAARALGDLPDLPSETVMIALTEAAKDSDAEVRAQAIVALGRAGAAANSYVPAVEESLRDPDAAVRISAALAIWKIDPANERGQPILLDALNAGNGPIFLELGRKGDRAAWAAPTLVRLLAHPQAGIRALAARTLGQIGTAPPEAQPALELLERDSDPAVRRAAQTALAKISVKSGPAR